MQSIEPLALKALLRQRLKNRIFLIDVREPEEHALVRLRGSRLIPLAEIPSRVEEIKALAEQGYVQIVVYCRSGHRSELAINWLSEQGVEQLVNLRGGINAYAIEADPSLTPY